LDGSCSDARVKDWDAPGGSTFRQTILGPAAGGFSAEVHIFEGDKDPAIIQLSPEEPLTLPLESETDYMIITHVRIVSASDIDVQISSDLGGETHCTTVSGRKITNDDVQHCILVS
jgi:hypothetical protein